LKAHTNPDVTVVPLLEAVPTMCFIC